MLCKSVRVKSPRAIAASSAGGRPLGPASWSELHYFMRKGVQSIVFGNYGVTQKLSSYFRGIHRLYVTSKWSGIGTATPCVQYTQEALWHTLGIRVEVVFHAAFDNAPVCQDVLKESLCRHVFADVCLGADEKWMQDLKDKNLELLNRIEAWKKSGEKGMQLRRRIHEVNREYKAWIRESQHKFRHDPEASAPCLKTGKVSRLRPKRDGVHAEITSPTCVSWSAVGLQWGWIHESNRPLICWCLQLKTNQPHTFCLECVPRLDLDFIVELIGEYYDVAAVIVEPESWGMPISGHRLFVRGVLKSSFVPTLPFSVDFLAEHFFVERRLCASVFLMAPRGEVLQCVNAMAQSKFGLIRPFMRVPRDASVILTSKERQRLQHHQTRADTWRREMAASLDLDEMDEPPEMMCIFNIGQNVGHHKQPSNVAPRPLTGALMWSEARQGPLTVREHFCLQGLAVL